MQGIYEIKNRVNGKRYIGSSQDIKGRWWEHRWLLDKQKHYNPHLQHAWDKYGEANFLFIVLEEVTKEQLLSREQEYLDTLVSSGQLYNIAIDAMAAMRGRKRSSEAIQKTIETRRGYRHSKETCLKIGNANRNPSKEGRKRRSDARKKYYETHDNYWLGKKRPKETCQKISAANKGQVPWLKGKQHRPESIQKMRDNSGSVKPYPAFYNEITQEYIPAGISFAKMCRAHGFKYGAMWAIRAGITKQTKDGWRLATESEITSKSMPL